jgi:hypothetical protein
MIACNRCGKEIMRGVKNETPTLAGKISFTMSERQIDLCKKCTEEFLYEWCKNKA